MATAQALLTRKELLLTNGPPVVPTSVTPWAQTTSFDQTQLIDQHQSQEVIQTLLAACVGSMAYLRGLFPDDCFVKMRYGGSRSAVDYRLFSTENEMDDRETERRGTKVTRLSRGKLPEVDRLLDWLEKGVFQALADGQLKALQLAIYLDESRPELVAESYTFSFSYMDGTNVPELYITDLTGSKVTISDACKGAQQMTRRLLTITEGLSPLPGWLCFNTPFCNLYTKS